MTKMYKYLDKINFPSDLKKLKKSELKVLSEEVRKEMIKMVEEKQIDDIEVAKEVLLGWEDLVDAEGQEVPFNKNTLNQLLEVRGFATAVGFAFMESNEEIFVKN